MVESWYFVGVVDMNSLKVSLLLPLRSFQRKGDEFLWVCIVCLGWPVIEESDQLYEVSIPVVMVYVCEYPYVV